MWHHFRFFTEMCIVRCARIKIQCNYVNINYTDWLPFYKWTVYVTNNLVFIGCHITGERKKNYEIGTMMMTQPTITTLIINKSFTEHSNDIVIIIFLYLNVSLLSFRRTHIHVYSIDGNFKLSIHMVKFIVSHVTFYRAFS